MWQPWTLRRRPSKPSSAPVIEAQRNCGWSEDGGLNQAFWIFDGLIYPPALSGPSYLASSTDQAATLLRGLAVLERREPPDGSAIGPLERSLDVLESLHDRRY
jgi:hypothetical protein